MRLQVTNGIETSFLSFSVTHANAALGTCVAIVGIRAHASQSLCLKLVTPAFSEVPFS